MVTVNNPYRQRPRRMLADIKWNETSGVDHPANLLEGWAVMKSVGKGTVEAMLKAEQVAVRKNEGLMQALSEVDFTDAPPGIRLAVETLSGFLEEQGYSATPVQEPTMQRKRFVAGKPIPEEEREPADMTPEGEPMEDEPTDETPDPREPASMTPEEQEEERRRRMAQLGTAKGRMNFLQKFLHGGQKKIMKSREVQALEKHYPGFAKRLSEITSTKGLSTEEMRKQMLDAVTSYEQKAQAELAA